MIITIIFIAIYAYLFANSSRKISNALSVSKLQILNQKKITEVGSLSAAAAHELGTPLNSIFLILNVNMICFIILQIQFNRCPNIRKKIRYYSTERS